MFDLSFLQILSRAIAIILVLMVMGFSVAALARLFGDRSAVYDSKFTLNPFTHIDIFAFAAGIIGRVGWVRPITIDPSQLRAGRAAPVIIAIGAMVAVFGLGRLAILALPWVATSWPASSAAFTDATLRMVADISAWTLALNIIPLPPLLGGYFLQALLPTAHAWLVKRSLYVSIALLVLVVLTYRFLPGSVMGDMARILGAR